MTEQELRQQIKSIEEQHPRLYLIQQGHHPALSAAFTPEEKQASQKWDELVSLLAEIITEHRSTGWTSHYKKVKKGEYDGLY